MILALDPGSTQTALVYVTGGRPGWFAKLDNASIHGQLAGGGAKAVVCEMIASYGMAVGAEIFDTCVWIGEYRRHCNILGIPWHTITRTEVKQRLCHRTAGVNDAVIRTRLIDMYGGKAKAIGNKKNPGPLYGISGDVWAALAVAKAYEIGTT